ncbi:MAG: gliding motility lipoprotein GldH [Bacteroidales bacterium]|nr:gliding motility lipoprotein GldH [Bacteroidales bacterium]
MMARRTAQLLALVAALCMASCDGGVFYDRQADIDEHGWLPGDGVDFVVDVDDTNQVYNFLIGVRNTISYPYSNTFFFLHTTFPDGTWSADTLEFPLFDPAGRPLGRRTGRYVDARYYFRRNARFPMEGRYTFSLANGMRDSAITGLRNVGLRIEYSNMTQQYGQ